ncbi:MAG: hypothetical protein AABW50_05315 [Nanoarchaeota archaeon]
MVYKITSSKYWIFIETFIIAALILVIGFFLGFYVEFNRVNNVADDAKKFEIEALDLKLQNYYYQIMDEASCSQAIKQNFIFADDIYEKGLIIERYEQANQLSDEIKNEKKKYVLLKTELWLNSILLKEKCGKDNFHTVVYFYSDDQRDLAKKATQSAISNVLYQLKQEKGNEIILLPIAGDLDLNIVNLQKRIYNVTYLPSLVIDEQRVIEGFVTKDELQQYLK